MNDVRWEGFTHEEIYARVQAGPGRAASADAETAWNTVAHTIREVDAQLTRAAQQIGIGWEGPAAGNVRGGLTVMSNWALDAAGDAELTRDGVTAQADAAAHVRATMPPPRPSPLAQPVAHASAARLLLATPSLGALEDQRADDRAAEVELMNRYTSDSSTNQRMMDYWTPPPSVVVETVAPSPTAAVAVAAAGLLAPAAVSPRVIGAPVTRAGVAHGPSPGVVVPSGAGRATVDRTPVGAVPGAAPIPTRAGPAAGPVTPGFVPGVPGRGSTTARPPGAAGLPGEVRPVVPSPPSRAGPLPGGGLAPRSTGGLTVPGPGGVEAPLPPPPRELPGGGPPRSPFALPTEPSPGVLGSPVPGGPPEGMPAARGPVEPGVVAAGRGGTAHGTGGFLPFGAMPMSTTDREHRRPDYLVDDADAFADDRRFTPAVLVADDADGC